jgi:hypothetical protein
MQRTNLLLLAFAAAFLGAGPAPVQAAGGGVTAQRASAQTRLAAMRRPLPGEFDVLLVVLDDLGTDKLGIYAVDPGEPVPCASPIVGAIPTPTLDGLRSDGVLFTRCYANPTCSPTRAAILTGSYGLRTGMGHAVDPSDEPGYSLPAAEITLPELIRDANPAVYRRAAFGKWHLTDYEASDCHPAERGSERFEGHKGNNTSHYAWRKVTATALGSACGTASSAEFPAVPGLAPSTDSWDASVTRADAVAWVAGLSPTERFFAYVAFRPRTRRSRCRPTPRFRGGRRRASRSWATKPATSRARTSPTTRSSSTTRTSRPWTTSWARCSTGSRRPCRPRRS